jgi:predicted hydrocarbon binding protein
MQFFKQSKSQQHNHHGFSDVFRFDPEQGTIADWKSGQNIFATEDFIIGLINSLEEELGDTAAATMYAIGDEWGQRDALCFEERFEKEFDCPMRQANLAFLLETWWRPFCAQGWGRWQIDLSDRHQGFMLISLFDSVVAQTLGQVGKPVCFLYAGLFAGFFTELVRKPLKCLEIQCYSQGNNHCKFLLSGQERINAASRWLTAGATAKEIEQRLKQGGS